MEYLFNEELAKNYSVMGKLTGPVTVSFDITTRCNLKCVHCYNNSGVNDGSDDISDDEVLCIAQQVAELHPYNVCLCGGETLCRKNILKIMDVLKNNVGKISMVSNGFALTKDMALKLKKHGLNHIQISLDGAKRWQHDSFRGVGGAFQNAIAAIGYLKEIGIDKIATSLVPNKLNYRDMEAYMKKCYEMGIDTVRMMPFIPSGRGKSIGRKLMLTDMEYFEFVRSIERQKKVYADKMEIEWGDPLDHMRRMPFNAFNGLKTYCMEVKANADITVTTYLPIVVGNCKKHTLKEYWDKGYKYVWRNQEIIEYIEKIKNIYDFDKFEPAPYSGKKIYIDIFKEGEFI